MAQSTGQKFKKRLATCLTTAFMAVSTFSYSHAALCAQDLNPQNVKSETGYSNVDDVRLSSAYADFMRKNGNDPAALQAILDASEDTGVDFDLLLTKAILESQLGKYNKPINVNGGARGLYQYLPDTWLTVFSWYADQYEGGKYKSLADQITFDSNGRPQISDNTVRNKILDLRSDFYMSAFIKAMQVKYEEGPYLKKLLNRDPTLTDYYLIHFLGMPRATRFFRYLEKHPGWTASHKLSREARYNRGVFYNGRHARSFQQVYDHLENILTDSLKKVRQISDDMLAKQTCTVPLQKGTPVQAAPASPPKPTDI